MSAQAQALALAPHAEAKPIVLRPAHTFAPMAKVGVAMLLHDRLKLLGILAGVTFAVVLSNQQLATFGGLILKNILLAQHGGADLWITPPSTEQLVPGDYLSDSVLSTARGSRPSVAWAAPLLLGGGTIKLPRGGSEPIQILGVELPALHGGPWNVVLGDPADLAHEDAMFFEDSEREKLGGLNLGSVRELNGHRVQAVGFHVGLLPFGPSYSFTNYDTARELLHVDNHLESFVLVGVIPGNDPKAIAAELQKRLPDQQVMTKAEAEKRTIRYLLTRTPIGLKASAPPRSSG